MCPLWCFEVFLVHWFYVPSSPSCDDMIYTESIAPIFLDMRHFIRSHERNRSQTLKTPEDHRRTSLSNSNDSQLLRKNSYPASAFGNNLTSPNVKVAAKTVSRFNTVTDDINPITMTLVVGTMAFFIVAALFYSVFWRK